MTTVDPGNENRKETLRVLIGGDGLWTGTFQGGTAAIGEFSNINSSNTVWDFSGNFGGAPKSVAEAAAHESGHGFGLRHHSSYSGTSQTNVYDHGDANTAPIMGNSYTAVRGLWENGPNDVSSFGLQDDLLILSGTDNGFGYRTDDFGNTIAAATALAVSSNSLSSSSVIEQTTDLDSFSFTASAGSVSFTITPGSYVQAQTGSSAGATLDLRLEIRDASGNLVASADTSSLGETLTANLSSGTYYLVVASHGNYGDVGTYNIAGTLTPSSSGPVANAGGPYAVNEGGSVSLNGGGSSGTGPTYAWDLDGDGIFGETGASATRGNETGATPTFSAVGLDGASTYAVSFRVTDGSNNTDTTTVNITVANVAPTLTLTGASSSSEGSAYTIGFSATDPGADTISGWVVNWGDGSSTSLAGNATSSTHTFADNGSYTITVTATDEDGSYAATKAVTVTNVNPTASIAGAPASSPEGTAISLTGSATDPGTLDTFTYSWSVMKGGVAYRFGTGASYSFTPNDNASYVVTLVVTDKDGGTGSTSRTISVTNVAPTASIPGAPPTSPEGSAISLTGLASDPGTMDSFSYAWSVTKNGSAYSSGTGVSYSFTPNDNGIYVVTLAITDKDGGTGSTSATITATNVAPTATITGAPASSAEGTAISLMGSATDPGTLDTFTYAWNITKGGIAYTSGSGTSFNFTPNENATYIVTLTATDKDGGTGTFSKTVTVTNVNPTASIAGAPASSPEGTAISLTGSATDPGSLDTFTYAWSVTKGGSAYTTGIGASFSLTPNDNGTYVVTLTVTDKDGGIGTTSSTIAATNVAPTASITGAPASSPEGTAISLSGSATDPGTLDTFTYAWSVTKGGSAYTSGSGASFSLTPNDNGTYVVTLTVTDKDGGVGTTTKTITGTNVAPTATITGAPASSAEGMAISLSGSATDPGTLDTFTYAWSVTKGGAAYTSGSGASFSLTPNDNATYVVTLTVTDKDGGIGTASRTINVTNVAPTITLTGATSAAQGTSYTLGFSAADPGQDTVSGWVIDWGDGTSSSSVAGTATSAAHTFADSGSYTISVTATDEDGSYISTKGLTISNVIPTAAMSGAPASSAEGTAISLTGSATDSGSSSFTYAWSVTKGGAAYATGSGASFSFTPNDNGIYVVTLSATDSDGGVGSTTATITGTNVNPTATITGAPANSPEGTLISLSGSATDPGSPDTFTYAWSVTKGGAAYTFGSGASFSLTPNDNATYVVTLTVTDKDGGVSTTTRTITGTNVAPTATITGAPASSPEGTAISLSGSATDPGTLDTFTYAWGVTKNGSAYTIGSGASFSLTPNDNGTYVVTLVVTDKDGGTGTASKTITATNVNPTASIAGAPANSPEGTAISLTGSATDPGSLDTFSYAWSVTKGGAAYTTGAGANFSFTPDDDATYVVTLTVTDKDGGVDSKSRTISVTNVAPTLDLSGDSSVNEGSPYTILVGQVVDPGTDTVSQYVVSWGDGSSDTVLPVGTHTHPFSSVGSRTHVYADGSANYTITVDLLDEDGSYTSVASLGVSVANVAPTLTLSGSASATAGTLYTLSLASSDPGADTISSWSINWGDGNVETVMGNPSSVTHTYALADTTPTIAASATDEDGTFAAGSSLQISVVSTPADVTAPTAVLTASNINSAGGSSYSFTVVFSDDQGVLASDLNDSDVMISGPNGFSQAGHLVSLDSNSNGTPRSAIYSISAPGGSWSYAANGTYSVNLNDNALHDINGNAAAGGTLGSFKVAAPVPDLGGTSLDTAEYMGIMSPSPGLTWNYWPARAMIEATISYRK